MQLQSLKYIEWEGEPQEWQLEEISLGKINLLVGKNASGKTRILNVISSLANHLAGSRPASMSGDYDVQFLDGSKIFNYKIQCSDYRVIEESLSVDNKELLKRGHGGEGHIFAEDIDGGKEIRFQTPPEDIAAVARRDGIQHKFLEPLHAWGASVLHYYFGSPLGKNSFAVITDGGKQELDENNPKFNENNPDNIVALYRKAEKEFGTGFEKSVINDMGQIGYDIKNIGIAPLISLRINGNLPGPLSGLYVQEKDLAGITDQHSMSQGMFRAFSLLIHFNYFQMTQEPACILIDDIGEGLDFDRSCLLIDVLREKAKTSGVQLVLSTNDRFVMNRIPLEEWSVLQRRGSTVRVLNYDNSRELFEEFKFTGLSNFSFLEMDFASGGPAEERATRE